MDPMESSSSELSESQLRLASILKDKRTLLSAPGYAYNGSYYSALNSTVDLIECTYNYGRVQTALTQLNFGSNAFIQIQSGSLVADTWLILELPAVPANVYLPRGWGLAAINQITFTMGNSNVSNLGINYQTLFQNIMMECETEEKRSAILALCGEEQLTTTTGSVFAYIPLSLPFSRNCGLMPKLPFDTAMESSPISLNIQFNQRSSFIGGSGAAAYASAFASGRIFFRMGDFSNKDMSIGKKLKSDPAVIYTYPYIHSQSIPVSVTGNGSTTDVNVALQSFINADLVSISFGLVLNSDLTSPSGTGVVRPFNYERILDVKLSYNGLTMYDAPAEAYKLYNVLGQIGSGYVLNTNPSTGTTSPFTSTGINTYIINIDFSRIRSLCFEGQYQNVWRVAQQTMTLSFKTLTTGNYTLYATYRYNGAIENSGGESRIYFD